MSLTLFQRFKTWGLEVLASDPVSNLFAGRSYYNSTSDEPRFYNAGTASFQAFATGAFAGWVTKIKTFAADDGYTAADDEEIFVNPSAAAGTINLPATPSVGDRVRIIDGFNFAANNNITVGRNGELIEGVAADDTIDVNGGKVEYVFIGGAVGWKAVS